MAELRQLKLRRTNIKGQMTRMNNSLDGEIAASEAQIDNIRLAAVPAGAGEEALITEIQRDSDAERTVFEGSYYAVAAKANRKINAEAQQQIQAQPQNANNRVSNDRSLEIKLPVLKLPEFEGEYEEWLLFKDAFTTMIHQREGLTPIQKFQYLRSALRGEALIVIGGLETSAENYENAWELLTNAYENTKLLINTHLNHLLDFPIITKDKPASLKQLVVHIRTHLKALKTLKLPVDKWDELLIHLVKNKMDYNTKNDWEEETNRDKARRKTLEEFLTFLSERCRTFEMIDKGKNRQDISKPPVVKKQERRVVAVASASARECISCSEGHGVYQCPKFLKLPISERINEIKSKKLCLNCFGKGHYATA
ncbi:hypothetical protein KPH14_012629 [Odynerus spinipes]|uniref:Gag-pol polyprotein n=1 Tax=Odynerus spinipes TaxID=1348599 RepID=A0AAD9VKV3_9HYME|nr:hypothetical protein KPH14_012629 [Odynerus spinipes]